MFRLNGLYKTCSKVNLEKHLQTTARNDQIPFQRQELLTDNFEMVHTQNGSCCPILYSEKQRNCSVQQRKSIFFYLTPNVLYIP